MIRESDMIINPMTLDVLHICGFAGTGLVILAVFYSSLVYRGKRSERFSLLNHFISELGEVGISQAAWFFNSGLLLGGLAIGAGLVILGRRRAGGHPVGSSDGDA